jgi:hypothetical protein
MPGQSPDLTIDKIISQLLERRQQYVDGLAEIDLVFARHGIVFPVNGSRRRGPGRPRKADSSSTGSKATGQPRRSRGKFKETGEAMIIGLLTRRDKPTTTAGINAAWRADGRKGSADNALGKLTKEKQIKRSANPSGRGSVYSIH